MWNPTHNWMAFFTSFECGLVSIHCATIVTSHMLQKMGQMIFFHEKMGDHNFLWSRDTRTQRLWRGISDVHLWTHLGWANGQLKKKKKQAIFTLCLFTVFWKVAIQNVLTNNWGSIELSLPKHLIQTLNAKFQNYILILIYLYFFCHLLFIYLV